MNAEHLLAHFDRLEADRTVRIGIEGVARIGPHRAASGIVSNRPRG